MFRKPDDPDWGFSNAYFGNLTLGQRVLKMRKLRAVVSGHTHVGREELVRRLDGGGDVAVSVLASEYHEPVYVVVDGATMVG